MSGRLWRFLNLGLWMLTVVVASLPFLLPFGVAMAAGGALIGALLGTRWAGSRWRSYTFLLGAGLASTVALFLQALLTRSPGIASLLGARLAYGAAEVIPASVLSCAWVAALEALAHRHRAWRTGELAVIGAVFAALFAGHREGFVNRPFFFADPILGMGRDPLPAFLALGLGLACLLVFTLAKESRGRRTFAGLAMLLAAVVALFFALPQGKLKAITELHRTQGDRGKSGSKSGKEGEPASGTRGSEKAPSGSQKGEDGGLPDSFSDQSDGASDAPVAVVVFQSDFTPPMGYYYFRETAFSAYNGIRVVQDASGGYDRDLLASFDSARPEAAPGPWPFAFKEVKTTVALMAPHPKPFGLVDPLRYRLTGNPDPRRFFRAYEARSRALTLPPQPLLGLEAGDAEWSSEAWRHYTEGPSDPRYGQLVDRILAELPTEMRERPFARAVAIKLWLDKNGTYSLRTEHPEGPDPVGEFLFGDRRGHCVHFAHAACLLYRAAGVPARVATGYAAPAQFRFGGASLLLRARNAHAWPEVHLRGIGWTPLDISPAQVEDPPQDPPDATLQQLLGNMAMGEKPPDELPPPGPAPHSPWPALLRALKWAAIVLLVGILLGGYAVKLWRRWIPAFCRPEKLPRLAYRAALDTASALGLRRAYGENREGFAARLAVHSPAFAELTALHLCHALGAPGRDPESERCLALLRAVRLDLRALAGPVRRLFAALHPFPWWRVH